MRRFAWLAGLLLFQTMAMAQQTDTPAMGGAQSSDASGITALREREFLLTHRPLPSCNDL